MSYLERCVSSTTKPPKCIEADTANTKPPKSTQDQWPTFCSKIASRSFAIGLSVAVLMRHGLLPEQKARAMLQLGRNIEVQNFVEQVSEHEIRRPSFLRRRRRPFAGCPSSTSRPRTWIPRGRRCCIRTCKATIAKVYQVSIVHGVILAPDSLGKSFQPTLFPVKQF